MKKRSTLFAQETQEFDPRTLEVKQPIVETWPFIIGIIRWTLGWIVFTLLVVVSLIDDFTRSTSLYVAGYVNIMVGGLFAYVSIMAGNTTYCFEAAWAGMIDLFNKDIQDARKRSRAQWWGPFIGVLFGFLLVAQFG